MHQEHPILVLGSRDPRLAAALPAPTWDALQRLVDRLDFVRQQRGDIADHHLEVAMAVTNRERPERQPGAAGELADLLSSPPALRLFGELAKELGLPAQSLTVRRLQVNRMHGGDHNHSHRDTDDDPDYTLAIILYLTDVADYDGGELEFDGIPSPVKPQLGALVAFPADLGHKLRPLLDCRRPRVSIVVLLGQHDGPNRRNALSFQ